ncbi:MAG: hypothetical protein KF889_06390 [Alphaproteobacteria bacterium]|nr:hypothetical protein [Alphaproteobacteria bacterium]MCW5740447.1 hypothetical protein [Alphaproteobacteria bacterium]
MSAGEYAYLALVIGSFLVFAAAVIWLRADYVKFRDGRLPSTARLQVQMAE